MKDLLIEIGTEELPAGAILRAVEHLKEKLHHILQREDIQARRCYTACGRASERKTPPHTAERRHPNLCNTEKARLFC